MRAGGKRPLVRHGFQGATSDARQVTLWWGQRPAANIGVPAGVASGVDVVDLDRKPGGSGFASFEHARRALLTPLAYLIAARLPHSREGFRGGGSYGDNR